MMHRVEIEVPDRLAEELKPHEGKLTALLELGLEEWRRRREGQRQSSQERILRALAALGTIRLPVPYENREPYVRQTPVSVQGKPVSEIVVEQRDR